MASEEITLESRMRSKDSCPVWREGVRKSAAASGNSLAPYSTARTVLRGLGAGDRVRLPDECYLEVRVPRVRLPDGSVRLIEPDWIGKLDGFTLLFEALVLALCREMTFAAVAHVVNLSWHRVKAICDRYVDLAVAATDLSELSAVAIDETSCRRGHDYVSLVDAGNCVHIELLLPKRPIGLFFPASRRFVERVPAEGRAARDGCSLTCRSPCRT